MISYGMQFDIEGADELIEQTRLLRDLSDSLRHDFLSDNDENVPHFYIHLGAQVQQTENGPRIHFEMDNKLSVVATLNERKRKIEELLEGIDVLTQGCADLEKRINASNNI